jgi:uncharacterized Tic20 family protein
MTYQPEPEHGVPPLYGAPQYGPPTAQRAADTTPPAPGPPAAPSAPAPPPPAPPPPGSPGQQGWRANPVTPGPPHGPDGPPLDTSEERMWATLAHLGGLLAVYPPIGVLPCLLIFLTYRRRSTFVRDQALEAMNFQIAVLIAGVAARILAVLLIPGWTFVLVWIVSAICSVLGGVAANRGERYRYPWTFRFIT